MPWFFGGRSHWLAESVKATMIIALWRSSVLIICLYFSGRAKFRQRPPPLTASFIPIFLIKADRAFKPQPPKLLIA